MRAPIHHQRVLDMKSIQATQHRGKFEPALATRDAQAAMMMLAPGGTSDEEVSNEHPHSEQWLFVISGTGTATIVPRRGSRRSVKLRAGTLLVIEKGDRHQIKNTGKKRLSTLNFYVPPAYDADGELRK
jgi:mannose-6-phosphate isomerase-like protein (cupin superfamily)